MDAYKLNELIQLAVQKMDKGDFKEALDLAYHIQRLGSNWLVSYVASGLLIDVGNALRSEKVIREGRELLQKDLGAIAFHKEYASASYYNLANAELYLFDFEKMRNPEIAYFRKSRLENAKTYYRKSLDYHVEDSEFTSQVLVNLGNCYDNLGRVVDAIECYDKSLESKPDHGMALGNKGLALLHYATLSGEHEGKFIVEAYYLLMRALRSGVPPEATSIFEEYLKSIRENNKNARYLEVEPKFPGYKIRAKSKLERFLIQFCLENRLYLNVCDFCQKCDAAIGDTAIIRKMIVPVNENYYLASSAYLNHMKQDFVTARFLLVLSRYEGSSFDFVDRRVRMINTFDHSIQNIYVQLVKASFRILYDILDKIAYFINDYLKIGIPEKDIDFRRLWRAKDKTIRKEIQRTNNLSLNALFDICQDFESGPYKNLRNMRNAITHRFVNIKVFQEIENDENMTETTLVERTIELAKIVRSAILYLLHFVHVEENRKELMKRGKTLPIFAQDLPDNIKASQRFLQKTKKNRSKETS